MKSSKNFEFEQNSVVDQKLLDASTGEVTDLVEELRFSEDLSDALENHSAKQVYWECLAASLVRAAQEYEAIGYGKWVSHSRHYAKLSLKGMGSDRVTIADIQDEVIRIFGKDASEKSRENPARNAFYAQLCIDRGGVRNAESFRKSDSYHSAFREFKKEMFAYLEADPPWTYEKVNEVLYNLKEQAEKVRAIARAFDKRSYSMKEFTDLEKAKFGNIGPLSVTAIVEEVASKVEQKLSKNSVIDERNLMNRVSSSRRK